MSKSAEKEERQPKWRQIPNLKPPVRELKYQDDGDPAEADEFNEMIRRMRREGRARPEPAG